MWYTSMTGTYNPTNLKNDKISSSKNTMCSHIIMLRFTALVMSLLSVGVIILVILVILVITLGISSSEYLAAANASFGTTTQIISLVQILSGIQVISNGGTANLTSSSGQTMSLTLPSDSSGNLTVALPDIAVPSSEIGNFEIKFLGDIWDLNLSPFDACNDANNTGCHLTFTFTDNDLIEAETSDFFQAVAIFQDTQKDGTFTTLPTIVIDDIAPTYTALTTVYFTTTSSLFGFGVFGNTTTYCITPITQFDQIIIGTNSNDIINGTSSNDLIFGLDGNDLIYGNNGDDCIMGGIGDDVISGGNGTDHMSGNAGDDIMYGGNDSDILYGNENNDIIYGNTGDDYIMGNTGDDTMYGGMGNDVLYGSLGDDFISGGQGGADVCVGNGSSNGTMLDCEL